MFSSWKSSTPRKTWRKGNTGANYTNLCWNHLICGASRRLANFHFAHNSLRCPHFLAHFGCQTWPKPSVPWLRPGRVCGLSHVCVRVKCESSSLSSFSSGTANTVRFWLADWLTLAWKILAVKLEELWPFSVKSRFSSFFSLAGIHLIWSFSIYSYIPLLLGQLHK